MAPAFFPFEFALFSLRTVQKWFTSASTTEFFLQRLYPTLDFILAEIAKKNLLYSSQISCQLAPVFEERKAHSMRWLKHPVDTRFLPAEVIVDIQVDAEDSIQRLVDFCTSHDQALIYFYTNYPMEVQSSSLPNVQIQRKSRSLRALKRSNLARMKFSHSIGTVRENESPEGSLSSLSNHGEDSGLSLTEDSSNGNPIKRRKDACCSPMHNLVLRDQTNSASNSGMHKANSSSAQNNAMGDHPDNESSVRRHTIAGTRRECNDSSNLSKSTRISNSAFPIPPVSSDSEADNTEQFFIPRRQRSNSSAYDGEPEQSD